MNESLDDWPKRFIDGPRDSNNLSYCPDCGCMEGAFHRLWCPQLIVEDNEKVPKEERKK